MFDHYSHTDAPGGQIFYLLLSKHHCLAKRINNLINYRNYASFRSTIAVVVRFFAVLFTELFIIKTLR